MVLNKWFVALLQLVMVAVTALQAARVDGVTIVEVWQLVAIIAGAGFAVYFPLLKGKWHAALKVIAALLAAAFAAIIPIATEAFTVDSAIIVLMAIVNAAAIQFGVDARIDGVKAALIDPAKSNSAVAVTDPAVYTIATDSIGGVGAGHGGR